VDTDRVRAAGSRVAAVARGAGRPFTGAGTRIGRGVRRFTSAEGAGESGLAKLMELHGINNAGDALIAVSLANTLFFSVPVGEARGRVALYLLVTMAPFAVMAPVIGPLLDRVRAGRRYAIAATMVTRAFLCWVMAGAIAGEGLALYPAAFGCLVCSKAYGVTRSATVPRLLPEGFSLVRANSRISLTGIVAGAVAAGVAAGLSLVGPQWSLRLAFLVFGAGMVLALALPRHVDSAEGEEQVHLHTGRSTGAPGDGHAAAGRDGDAERGREPGLRTVGPSVVLALRANASLRAFSGFLTMFLAFLLRQNPIGGLNDTVAIGLVAAAAGVGNTVGTALGAWLRARAPELIVTAVLAIAAATAVTGAWLYGLVSVLAIAAAAGLAQSLGKLSLDALIQRDIPEQVRTSAFARSETLLQLSWVVGGGLGIALPLRGDLGLGAAAAGLVMMLALTLRALFVVRRERAAMTVSASQAG
jgi:MFS family permease